MQLQMDGFRSIYTVGSAHKVDRRRPSMLPMVTCDEDSDETVMHHVVAVRNCA